MKQLYFILLFIGLVNIGFAQTSYIRTKSTKESQIQYSIPNPKNLFIPDDYNYWYNKQNYKLNEGYKFCIYYCPPNSKKWFLDIYAGIFMSSDISSYQNSRTKLKFYGKKSYKYAYSWLGEDSKPIKLNPVNEANIITGESNWQVE